MFIKKFCPFFVLLITCFSCVNTNDENNNLSVFRYNESSGILTLDPAFAKDLPHIWACNQLYNSLVSLNEKMEIEPSIAKNWEISEDGKTYTFHLRNDVYFHKNPLFGKDSTRKVVASDVLFSFSRLVDRSLNSPGSWIFSSVENDLEGYHFKALNDSTFQIKLSKNFPPFLGMLSMTYASIVPHEIVGHFGTEFRNHPIGTGPFAFQYWKEGVKMVFRKNQIYFEKEGENQLPYIDAVSISFLIDRQIAFLEFIKGNFDFMSGIDSRYKDELLTFDGHLRKKYQNKINLIREPFLNTEYVGFFVENHETLDKERYLALRKAINYGIDREKMLRFLRNGIGKPAYGGMIPEGMLGDSKPMNYGYSYQPNIAGQLIKENSLLGTKINLSTTAEYADLGKYIQSQLTSIGLDATMEVMPPATMRQMRANGSLPFFRASWVADYPDAENYLSLFYSANKCPNGPNYTHYSNQKFDELYDKAMYINDIDKRFELYRQMDSIVMSEAPVLVLFYDEVLRFVNPRVSELKSNHINLLDLKTVKIEH